jgi:hypothetical protein
MFSNMRHLIELESADVVDPAGRQTAWADVGGKTGLYGGDSYASGLNAAGQPRDAALNYQTNLKFKKSNYL